MGAKSFKATCGQQHDSMEGRSSKISPFSIWDVLFSCHCVPISKWPNQMMMLSESYTKSHYIACLEPKNAPIRYLITELTHSLLQIDDLRAFQ